MISRIVKMTFRAEEVPAFLSLFNDRKHLIAGFDGCKGVELLQDIRHQNIFFTYSYWESPDHLESYRKSGLFSDTWTNTKTMFEDKAQAWSVLKVS